MELAGGAGFYRAAGLERRFRDIQAARYRPLQAARRRNTRDRWRSACRWRRCSDRPCRLSDSLSRRRGSPFAAVPGRATGPPSLDERRR